MTTNNTNNMNNLFTTTFTKPVNKANCGWSICDSIETTKKHIKVEGHKGYWYVIDCTSYMGKGKFYLCEHETYGDEVACVIIDENYNLILDDVWNGFNDLEETWEWEKYENNIVF